MAKMYRPYTVSRNERLAYQLIDDNKIDIVPVRKRNIKTKGLKRTMLLAEFVIRRQDRIHRFK